MKSWCVHLIKEKGSIIIIMILSLVIGGCTDDNRRGGSPGAISGPVITVMTEFAGDMHERYPIDEEYDKRTGIAVHQLAGTPMTDPRFNLLLASGDLPDIFMNTWLQYPGGPEKAIDQGYIMPLNDLIDQYAPNFKKMLQQHPEIDRMIKTDSGTYYAFPFIRSEAGRVYGGPIIRKDWLDELGLAVPETIDEWHTVLSAFKGRKGATVPITFRTLFLGERTAGFAGAFGVIGNFYVEDGKVKYGYLEPGYRDYLTTMSDWYREGLIDRDFALVDLATVDMKILMGQSGATIGWQGYIEKYNAEMQASGMAANFVAAPYPTLVKGARPKFGQLDNAYPGTSSAAISARSPHAETAARWLDYAYSEEGMMLNTFGIEGVTYTLVDGVPQYTKLVTANPDGLTSDQVMLRYAHQTNFPMIQRDSQLTWKFEQTTDSLSIWRETDHEKYLLPPITPKADEASELSGMMSEIQAFVKETELKIILGEESIDAYDKMADELKRMGIGRVLEIKQAAYERYLKR